MSRFTDAELTRTSQKLPNKPGPTELAALHALRDHVLDPLRERIGQPISVNSGYRSPAVNRAVGGSATSDHMKGRAADIVVGPSPGEWADGWDPERLAREILASGVEFDQLIWEPTWVHVSYRPGANRRQTLRKTSTGTAGWTP